MADSITTIESLKNDVKKCIEEREWQQFHSPKNLSMAIVSEATELMDLFLWCENAASYQELEKHRQDVEDEVADIAFALLSFCIQHKIDLSKAVTHKQIEKERKYPVEKCKGKSTKYTEL
jgi:NTP pyrophosphatase (non-canonical NTP hydrolase)